MKTFRPLSAAQRAALQAAVARPSWALEPLPPNIKGAARQAVVEALVARGYATRCYFPRHVEYVLTDLGASVVMGDSPHKTRA